MDKRKCEACGHPYSQHRKVAGTHILAECDTCDKAKKRCDHLINPDKDKGVE